jgi:hypothetical protein
LGLTVVHCPEEALLLTNNGLSFFCFEGFFLQDFREMQPG